MAVAAAVADRKWSGYQTWIAGDGSAVSLPLTVAGGALQSGMLLQGRRAQTLDAGSQSPAAD